jgi:hypothetical protein
MSVHITGGLWCGLNQHSLGETLKHTLEHTTPTTAKNQIKHSVTNSVEIKNNNLSNRTTSSTANSNCANNLNLTSVQLDKLTTEIASSIYNRKQPRIHQNDGCRASLKDINREGHYKNVNTNVTLNRLDYYHIDLVSKMYHYLQSNSLCEYYIILAFYKKIDETSLIAKQLLTVVPFIDNKPMRSFSEISIITNSGKVLKYNRSLFMHAGGYVYTNDWLSIIDSVIIEEPLQLYKLTLVNNNKYINGISFINYKSAQCEKLNFSNYKLHIPGFSSIWM